MCTPEDLEKIKELEAKIANIEDRLDELVDTIDFKRAVNGNDSVEVQSVKDQQETLISLMVIYEKRLAKLQKKCNVNNETKCPVVLRSYVYGY